MRPDSTASRMRVSLRIIRTEAGEPSGFIRTARRPRRRARGAVNEHEPAPPRPDHEPLRPARRARTARPARRKLGHLSRGPSPGVDPEQLARRPLTVRILLENLVRHYDPRARRRRDDRPARELRRLRRPASSRSTPSRVLLQDFTGVPGARRPDRDAVGGGARAASPVEAINPEVPVDLIVDHSVQVDSYGTAQSLADQPRPRVRAERRAVRPPPLGQQALPERPDRAPRERNLPPGQPRVPRLGRRPPRRTRPGRRSRSRTPSSGRTPTRRWSTASACSAGASAGSRPRR